MSEHFIKNIEIKNFKCFKDFKAEGFGRVNLIGGKNNVGKTAFMEACFLSTAMTTTSIYNKLLEIDTHRNVINLLLSPYYRKDDIKNLILENKNIAIFSNFNRLLINEVNGILKIKINEKIVEQKSLSDLITFLDINMVQTRTYNSINFISQNSSDNHFLNTVIDDAKLNNKLNILNEHLQELFHIESIDTIKYKPFIKVGIKYNELSKFGQGIKTFIHIISSMLLLNNNFIFIDEIENGIHYSHLDRFWEIILTISKQQNVQVFATTHSKECIESYARVAKKLEDEEIKFIELGRNKSNKIRAIVMDNERFFRDLEVGNEVRGW